MKVTATDRQSVSRTNQHNRSIVRLSLVLLALSFVFGVVRPTLSGPKPAASLTVLVYNYAEVSPATLATAEREATKILAAAGVQVVWVDCLESLPSSESKELCKRGWSAQTPGLRLLSGHITRRYEDREFGFAAIPVLATINYERIAAWYGRDGARDVLPIMLGCVMAHELGHLMLRDPDHSTIGIMQPQLGLRFRGDAKFSGGPVFGYQIKMRSIPFSQPGEYIFHFRGIPDEEMSLQLYVEGKTDDHREELTHLGTTLDALLVDQSGQIVCVPECCFEAARHHNPDVFVLAIPWHS